MEKRYGKDSNAFVSPYLRRRLRPLDEVLVLRDGQALHSGHLGTAAAPGAMTGGLSGAVAGASDPDGTTRSPAD